MSVVGKWTLFYDWNCDESYSSTSMDVKADGTWTNGEGFSGLWVHVAGMFMFHFNNYETTYAGNHASLSITGIMTTFSGKSSLTGCFYMLKSGVRTTFADERDMKKANSLGEQ